jgi:hypothetical protein
MIEMRGAIAFLEVSEVEYILNLQLLADFRERMTHAGLRYRRCEHHFGSYLQFYDKD